MIEINSNADEVFSNIIMRLEKLANQDSVIREVATEMAGPIKDRIHVRGEDATGAQIGTYSKEYMKVRTGLFSTNATFKRGQHKGQTKPTGVFTKGKNKGAPRPQFNRDSDTKVIISLTREMENDWSVQADGSRVGLGYSNAHNADKADWAEHTYGKKIFALTPGEHEQSIRIAEQAVNRILSGEA